MVQEALAAAAELERNGIHATVVNSRFVKPLDETLILRLCLEIPRVLIVEENALQGGFGSAVLELLADHNVALSTIQRIGLPDQFIEHGNLSLLREKYGLTAGGIVRSANLMIQRSRPNLHIRAI
jgi:1-deoxy-D-xylulose-5-phosphate synthase